MGSAADPGEHGGTPAPRSQGGPCAWCACSASLTLFQGNDRNTEGPSRGSGQPGGRAAPPAPGGVRVPEPEPTCTGARPERPWPQRPRAPAGGPGRCRARLIGDAPAQREGPSPTLLKAPSGCRDAWIWGSSRGCWLPGTPGRHPRPRPSCCPGTVRWDVTRSHREASAVSSPRLRALRALCDTLCHAPVPTPPFPSARAPALPTQHSHVCSFSGLPVNPIHRSHFVL